MIKVDLPPFPFAVIDSLSNLSVRIPEFLQKGETADLTCSYNLGGDTLYSVKWYKGRHEFYRYMPHELPQIKTFPVKGMKINVSSQVLGSAIRMSPGCVNPASWLLLAAGGGRVHAT